MHGMQLYIYIQHKARHILENSSIWWDFANCLDCISNSKYEYEHLSPSVFCISILNCFRCVPEHRMEQASLEAYAVHRGKQKGWAPPVTHLWCLGLELCTAKALIEDLLYWSYSNLHLHCTILFMVKDCCNKMQLGLVPSLKKYWQIEYLKYLLLYLHNH